MLGRDCPASQRAARVIIRARTMDAPIPAAAPVTPGAAFAHRDFRRYVVSSLALNLGAQMTSVAVGWQIYALTHRAISLGYVGLVQFAPMVLTATGLLMSTVFYASLYFTFVDCFMFGAPNDVLSS